MRSISMDTIIVIAATLLAGFFLWKQFSSNKGGCSCGSDCSSCDGDKNARVYGLKEKECPSAENRE